MAKNNEVMVNDPNEPIQGEVVPYVDQRNGTTSSKGASDGTTLQIIPPNLDLTRVGTLDIDAQARKVLDAPLDEKDILIRPDGMVYVDWTWYARRLNDAFGRGKWGLIPQSPPMSMAPNGNSILVVWPHWLVVKGVPMGMAIGECSYFSSNYGMSYADACEGAKSIALSRACKQFGMTLDMWNKEFIEYWKAKYAEYVKNPKGKPEMIWVKKPSEKVEADALHAGKVRLARELKPWYPTPAGILAGLEQLGVFYSLEAHDDIRQQLIELHFAPNNKPGKDEVKNEEV